MDSEKLLNKFCKRLKIESVIKSVVCGLIAGFTTALIAAAVCYAADYNGLWIAITAFLVFTAALTALFYFRAFKPTVKKAAERADRLGLDERLITMIELSGDDSFIANKQRENAKEKVNAINPKRLKLAIFKLPVIAAVICAMFSITMTTMMVLNAKAANEPPPVVVVDTDEVDLDDLIGDLKEIVENSDADAEIKDAIDKILDEFEKSIDPNDSAEEITEKLNELSDELNELLEETEPELNEELQKRIDEEKDKAEAQQQEESEPNDEQSEEEQEGGQEEGQVDDEQPSPEEIGDEIGDDQNPGEDKGVGNENEIPDDGTLKSENIIDGTVPHREVLEDSKNESMDRLSGGEDFTDDDRSLIEAYYEMLK